jgi:hypothetical protein
MTPDYYKPQYVHPLVDPHVEAVAISWAYGLDCYRGPALKYLLRAGRKPEHTAAEDIRKCISMLERYIEVLETP